MDHDDSSSISSGSPESSGKSAAATAAAAAAAAALEVDPTTLTAAVCDWAHGQVHALLLLFAHALSASTVPASSSPPPTKGTRAALRSRAARVQLRLVVAPLLARFAEESTTTTNSSSGSKQQQQQQQVAASLFLLPTSSTAGSATGGGGGHRITGAMSHYEQNARSEERRVALVEVLNMLVFGCVGPARDPDGDKDEHVQQRSESDPGAKDAKRTQEAGFAARAQLEAFIYQQEHEQDDLDQREGDPLLLHHALARHVLVAILGEYVAHR